MTNDNSLPQAEAAPEQLRKRRLILLGLACALGLVGYATYWGLVARYQVSTDNAYVQGNVVQITPQVAGTVLAIEADDTDRVKAGQLLVRLDPVDARIALDQAAAQLAETVREVRATFTTNNALGATISARETDLERLSADLARRQSLVDGGAVSLEEIQHLQTSIAGARASLLQAREELARNSALTEGTRAESHPRVLAAAEKYREAWLSYKRAGIAAPLSGTVARRSVQVGQRVSSGMPLMTIVALDQLWVDANFKESQLEDLRIGQPVSLRADVYGHGTDFHGRVSGLGAGTGAAFSLLPAQNATGNWIKVVQRVPVRIALDPKEVAEHPLRVGLSMEVTVDVHDQSGKPVAAAERDGPVASTQIFDDLTQAVDDKVNAIVSANLGHRVSLPHAK